MAQLYQAMDTLPIITLANYENSRAIYEKAFGSNHPTVAATNAAQATFYYHRGQLVSAISLFTNHLDFKQNYLQQYFDYLGEAEREAFYKTVKDDFEQYTELSFREYKKHPELLATAYHLQLRYKALLLNTSNLVKKRILASGDRQLIALYDEVQALKQLLGQTASLSDKELLMQRNVKRDSLKHALATKDQQLTQFSGFYAGENKQPDWQDIKAKLGKNEAAVEVIRFRTYDYRRQEFTKTVQYAALIVTAKTTKQPAVVFFGDGNYLESKAISFYRNGIRNQHSDEESYKNFWKPLQRTLKKIKKVYFSPDGVFHSLNMETLYNPETGKYLKDEIKLELITSGKDLLQVKQAPLPQKLGLLIGNPAFGGKADVASGERNAVFNNLLLSVERGSGVSPLPGTEKEVQQIQSLLKANKWRETTLLNAEAKEEILKNMLKPNVLHIATHGFFQQDIDGEIKYNTNPLYRSGILLSGAAATLENKADLRGNVQAGKEDGILTAFEALNLNIDNTDLVVLSACETGLGEIRNGEGVFGLQRAFKLAGARSILMSLWKVNDQTTQELMVSFYQKWLGGMTKRAAFEKAQSELKTKYPQPYYWGAFVLIGE
ncbi:MAG: CHAT domain-containing protein [Cytophagales bacterium]